MLRFYETIRSTFCGRKILTESVFVDQLSSNAGIQFYELCWLLQIVVS